MNVARACVQCSAPIDGCFGFVKAGDVLIEREVPRELCGKCALIREWTGDDTLVRRNPED